MKKQLDSKKTDSSNELCTLLPVVPIKKPKCFNCKHASYGFKITGKTHYQCLHPKHNKGLEDGSLTAWDTLQEFYNTCDTHEFR